MNGNLLAKKRFVFLTMIAIVSLFTLPLSAQNEDQQVKPPFNIQIDRIDRTLYKNFLGIPKTVDYRLSWRVMELQNEIYVDTNVDRLTNYEVLFAEDDSTFMQAQTIRIVNNADSCEIPNLEVGKKYFFRVQAVDQNNQIYQSQIAWMRSGKQVSMGALASEDEESSWLWYLPISGRFPLTLMGYGHIFDKSTLLGKFAFHIIWWFFLFGLLSIFYGFYHLNLGRIFPFSPITLTSVISPLNYETQFQTRKLDKFFGESGLISKWKEVIDSVAKLFEKPPKMEGDKKLDIDKLRIESATFWRDTGRTQIIKIREEMEAYRKYPTARILSAGLANHETNGFKFMEASEEVDRAIENRAMMELEQLKGKTKIEWLWSLAATAPLVGLFGTVTGISVAFQKLAIQSERGIIDTTTKISELAGGINEALWTTIFGLTVGIILVLFYYLFKNKLDWIYGKWEEIYVDVSEKL